VCRSWPTYKIRQGCGALGMVDRMVMLKRVTAYYVVLGVVVALVNWIRPDFSEYISEQLYTANLSTDFSSVSPGISSEAAPALLIAMVVAIILMVPVSWVYMGTRERAGYQQSVVQTIMLLPIAVAGVVVVVQNSVALAFSLAGIVAAVRFRTTLKNKSDALYIFVSIGIGLASGIGAMAVAAVLSFVFSYANITMLLIDYGDDGGTRLLRRQETRQERWEHREAIRNGTVTNGEILDLTEDDEDLDQVAVSDLYDDDD
jgi:hypothetical protein